ncbi:hypothetical protein CT0861_09105 [Colletotrichum tofieldiae]|uniref:Uncharacterized protein n=1 Tax=Colletotrichum tofieldiae TaxID=708197 RepID=A0A161W9W2_9PEZI|nr:hypothetical protein CT0861_09105 [Colletotrichum tofieldiae]
MANRPFPEGVRLPNQDRFIKNETTATADKSPPASEATALAKEPELSRDKSLAQSWDINSPRLARPIKASRIVFGTDHGGDLVSVNQKVFLDGPYGHEIHLEAFRTVTLIAQGCGIFGALPHAIFLAQRAFHNRDERNKMKKERNSLSKGNTDRLYGDMTRKINIFWILEVQAQDKLAVDEFANLMSLDDGHALLHVYIMYPKPVTGSEDTLRIPDHVQWQRSYGSRENQYKLLGEVLTLDSYGIHASAILVSGNITFVEEVESFIPVKPMAAFSKNPQTSRVSPAHVEAVAGFVTADYSTTPTPTLANTTAYVEAVAGFVAADYSTTPTPTLANTTAYVEIVATTWASNCQ